MRCPFTTVDASLISKFKIKSWRATAPDVAAQDTQGHHLPSVRCHRQ
jgi:hypothetical protein